MRALILLVLLTGCATSPQCSVGISLIGPMPVPYVSCDLIFEPKGAEEEDDV